MRKSGRSAMKVVADEGLNAIQEGEKGFDFTTMEELAHEDANRDWQVV